jgi:GNAT superfamily N-acetyltransferase
MKQMKVVELERSHLEEAGQLFAAAYSREREMVPILDENFGTAEKMLPKLKSCLEKNRGVAVCDNSGLAGFMAGFYIDGFLGTRRGAYCPEWAHGSTEGNAFGIYRLMYRELGKRWAGDGCLAHAVNFMNRAEEAQRAFSWNGFGGICLDAVRPVGPIAVELPDSIRISPMREADVPVWLPMMEAQARHLTGSPSFIPHLEPKKAEDLRRILEEPGNLAWMAWQGGEALGYMRIAPIERGAAWMVNGERKFAINGAYVKPEYRGRGIAAALLSAIMDWGVKGNYSRCSVDFEATNPEACGFWLKHFRPVCRSMVRRLDERILTNI